MALDVALIMLVKMELFRPYATKIMVIGHAVLALDIVETQELIVTVEVVLIIEPCHDIHILRYLLEAIHQ